MSVIADTQFFQRIRSRNIGFVSTRFHGTDGVTLEAKKWARALVGDGHACYWMAGELDTPEAASRHAPKAYFREPEIAALHQKIFGVATRSREITDQIQRLKEELKEELYRFIDQFQLDVLIPQNALAIPLHIPLGMAITEVIAETGIAVIAHHHDFSWERERFTVNGAPDYLQAAFPPALHHIVHVVINTMQQRELSRRFGLSSTLIPNVIDFETDPPGVDDYNADFRSEIGLKPDDILVLQPTRVVARKGIEHAIELIRRLRDPRVKLVISHPAGDEGDDYFQLIHERLEDSKVEALFVADRVAEKRGRNARGEKVYTLFDVYPHADLVTYPSLYEGFGNAFLEAVYFRRPCMVNAYAVYARDIAPLGFQTVAMDQVVSNKVIEQTRRVLSDPEMRREWGEVNFELGRRYFSYSVLRRHLASSLAELFGEGA